MGGIFPSAPLTDKSELSVMLWSALEDAGGRVEKQQRKRSSRGMGKVPVDVFLWSTVRDAGIAAEEPWRSSCNVTFSCNGDC